MNKPSSKDIVANIFGTEIISDQLSNLDFSGKYIQSFEKDITKRLTQLDELIDHGMELALVMTKTAKTTQDMNDCMRATMALRSVASMTGDYIKHRQVQQKILTDNPKTNKEVIEGEIVNQPKALLLKDLDDGEV